MGKVQNTQFKQMILKAYNSRMREAFTKWKVAKGARMNQSQMMVVEEFQSESKALTNEIVEEKRANQDLRNK